MTLNPYEPPPLPAHDDNLATRDSSPPSHWQRRSRFVALAIGLVAAPILALGIYIGLFRLLVLLVGWTALEPSFLRFFLESSALVVSILPPVLLLKRLAIWLDAPEGWEIASLLLTVAGGIAILIGRFG